MSNFCQMLLNFAKYTQTWQKEVNIENLTPQKYISVVVAFISFITQKCISF